MVWMDWWTKISPSSNWEGEGRGGEGGEGRGGEGMGGEGRGGEGRERGGEGRGGDEESRKEGEGEEIRFKSRVPCIGQMLPTFMYYARILVYVYSKITIMLCCTALIALNKCPYYELCSLNY